MQRSVFAPAKPSQPQPGRSLVSDGDRDSSGRKPLSKEDDAKLMFGTIFSLRNMVKQLGGEDDTYAMAGWLSVSLSSTLMDFHLSKLFVLPHR